MIRTYPQSPLVGVGAVIIHDGRALLVRRNTEPLKGEWSVPGGLLELGEKLRDGCAREALEETGLSIEVGEVLDVFDSIFPDADGRAQYHFVLIDFLCTVEGGPHLPAVGKCGALPEAVAASDVSAVQWVTADDLDRLNLRPSIAQVIRQALAATQTSQ